jgi:hypothetical protein
LRRVAAAASLDPLRCRVESQDQPLGRELRDPLGNWSGRDRHLARCGNVGGERGAHREFDVGSPQDQTAGLGSDQEVLQDRQRGASGHDAAKEAHGVQQAGLIDAQMHGE